MAGGTGSRLWPCRMNKHLLPVYDKPMLYYPLSVLMLAGIRKFCIIVDPESSNDVEFHLGNGRKFGVEIRYQLQYQPAGIADGIRIGSGFIDNHPFALMLGDNVFHGHDLPHQIMSAIKVLYATNSLNQGIIFAKEVRDPERFGNVLLDDAGEILAIEEKPEKPRSNLAIPGLYLYEPSVVKIVNNLQPSPRGELEITDVNRQLMENKQLLCAKLGRGIAWLDTGTPAALMQAAAYVQAVQDRQGLLIACLEEISKNQGWSTYDDFLGHEADYPPNSTYSRYVRKIWAHDEVTDD